MTIIIEELNDEFDRLFINNGESTHKQIIEHACDKSKEAQWYLYRNEIVGYWMGHRLYKDEIERITHCPFCGEELKP